MESNEHNFTVSQRERISKEIQLASDPLSIESSTASSPIVLRVPQHGYSNGDKIVITDHLGNRTVNGNHTVANVTADTFELQGSTGTGVGEGGQVWSCIDATDKTLEYPFKLSRNDTNVAVEPTLTWIDRTRSWFTLDFTRTQMSSLSPRAYLYEIWLDEEKYIHGKMIVSDSI